MCILHVTSKNVTYFNLKPITPKYFFLSYLTYFLGHIVQFLSHLARNLFSNQLFNYYKNGLYLPSQLKAEAIVSLLRYELNYSVILTTFFLRYIKICDSPFYLLQSIIQQYPPLLAHSSDDKMRVRLFPSPLHSWRINLISVIFLFAIYRFLEFERIRKIRAVRRNEKKIEEYLV